MRTSVRAGVAALLATTAILADSAPVAMCAPRARPLSQRRVQAPVRRANQPALVAPVPGVAPDASSSAAPAPSLQAVPDPAFSPYGAMPAPGNAMTGAPPMPYGTGIMPGASGWPNNDAPSTNPVYGRGPMHGHPGGYGMAGMPAAGQGGYLADYPPPRLLTYGWPSMGVVRRDLPMPRKKKTVESDSTEEDPRKARLEIFAPAGARVFVDEEELFCDQGAYHAEPEKPLIPGYPEVRDVRIEAYDAMGNFQERTVTVYLRMGRLTQLFFE